MSNEPFKNHPTQSRQRFQVTRRRFLGQAGRLATGVTLATASDLSWAPMAAGAEKSRLQVAAVLTEFTYRSHAHVLLENFLEPYLFNGKLTAPGTEVLSFYVDQFSERDMARAVAAQYNIKIYPSIAGALCLGGERLAVDGVLSIGEHGKYPINEKGQQEYPRKRFFDEIVAVFRNSNRVAPVFNDQPLFFSLGLGWGDVRSRARDKDSVHGRQLGAAGGAPPAGRC